MKVLLLNGSPRRNGNTFEALSVIEKVLCEEGIDTEIAQVGSKSIRGCMACGKCGQTKNLKCALKDDGTNDLIVKMKEADGIVIGTPTHYANMSATLRSFLDRVFYVSQSNGNLFRYKVGAGIAVSRRGGEVQAFNQINNYLMYAEMMIASSSYWSVIHGLEKGEVYKDIEGIHTLEVLARNVAYMLKIKSLAEGVIEPPKIIEKPWTHFIR
jgi:multimeric flavodoxin WrbA